MIETKPLCNEETIFLKVVNQIVLKYDNLAHHIYLKYNFLQSSNLSLIFHYISDELY